MFEYFLTVFNPAGETVLEKRVEAETERSLKLKEKLSLLKLIF